MKKILWYVLAFILGILPGFFIVYNSIFSDSNGNLLERLFTYMLVIVIFGLLGLLMGRTGQNSLLLALALSLFSILLLVFYLGKEPESLMLVLIYLFLTFESSHMGVKWGNKWRSHWDKRK